MAFPAETTEAFLEGHNHAFVWFGGVPRTILFDNTKLAVAQILGDGTRMKTRAFAELENHYLFAGTTLASPFSHANVKGVSP